MRLIPAATFDNRQQPSKIELLLFSCKFNPLYKRLLVDECSGAVRYHA